jgi:hypothetical protein
MRLAAYLISGMYRPYRAVLSFEVMKLDASVVAALNRLMP